MASAACLLGKGPDGPFPFWPTVPQCHVTLSEKMSEGLGSVKSLRAKRMPALPLGLSSQQSIPEQMCRLRSKTAPAGSANVPRHWV